MNSKEQKTQEQPEAVAAGEVSEKAVKQTAVKNKRKKMKIEISFGKILALAFVIIAIIYFIFSTSVFWSFMRIRNNEKDAADQQGTAAEVLDDSYAGEEE